jgi:Flp pilus assembly protein TadG
MIRTGGQQGGEAGSALVEFAVVALVLLTLLFGIVDVGRALFAYDFVANAARLGTRFAMVRGTNCILPDGSSCSATQSDIQTYITSNATGINTSALTVTAICIGGASSSPPCTPGVPIRVTVQYAFAFISPLAPHSWTMTSSSQRVVSQ